MFFGATTGHWWADLLAIYGVVQIPALIGTLYVPELLDRLRGGHGEV